MRKLLLAHSVIGVSLALAASASATTLTHTLLPPNEREPFYACADP